MNQVHSNWSRIQVFPVAATPPTVFRALDVTWWFTPASTAIFVLFFWFGQESMEVYADMAQWVWTRVFRQKKWREDEKNLSEEMSVFTSHITTGQLDFYRSEFRLG